MPHSAIFTAPKARLGKEIFSGTISLKIRSSCEDTFVNLLKTFLCQL